MATATAMSPCTIIVVEKQEMARQLHAQPAFADRFLTQLHNAFKHTPAGGAVVFSAHAHGQRLLIEVQDQCGGMRDTAQDVFRVFGDRRGADRSGLGLGLSIARRAVREHGGDIHNRNLTGEGCIFTIDVPLATAGTDVLHRVRRACDGVASIEVGHAPATSSHLTLARSASARRGGPAWRAATAHPVSSPAPASDDTMRH